MNKRIVVFAPHPDDETMGCGGTVARKLSEGYEVTVVVLTDGRYSFSVVLGIDSDPSPEEISAIRKNETRRAVRILGLPENNLLFWDFEDNNLSKLEDAVESRMSKFLTEYSPVEVYFTYERDYNYDHQATSRIVKRCAKKMTHSPALYQYSIARPGTCGIYGRVRPIIDAVENLFRETYITVDISSFLNLKKKALNEFKSEISIISSKQTRPITLDPEHFLKDKEVFFLK